METILKNELALTNIQDHNHKFKPKPKLLHKAPLLVHIVETVGGDLNYLQAYLTLFYHWMSAIKYILMHFSSVFTNIKPSGETNCETYMIVHKPKSSAC